ncbi:MAG: hypothetical protein A2445_04870 [Candidatus Jacksonbacteria bacterium RIFOXYC2_FULL_44_29]|nr:MAG: hypothetical protein A2240_01155 [Candidatus Jacksonbacteria bacterium RIFOXYA2_FULL_43_12]OGY75655.1 MAG: hypothetical protein A2295_04750 [Candidatus Jacksonbacteria bacterium RIFOXYB2_FULL_44_15]OGY77799.1 MAG: hypothetical protein A2445_04870 [Candidatus Jacksonbacteria bacterium RIFOXYC2_FULL_44_29]OGY79529.1 MAG: hypothetical protein A2550_02160 [Candidatus Jacksonbacteria bacterium RIFOXYD2_FULL_43_21]HBH46400.1 hypothetical protein [Candidatus Jacksonbacteria bacterium]
MKQVLLLGKNGMLGQAIVGAIHESPVRNRAGAIHELSLRHLESIRVTLHSWGHQDLDITDRLEVIKKISQLKPSIVINATGFTDVDGAESQKDLAFAVNVAGPGYLAEVCNQINASLIHFSTDYVFDGSQERGYEENDQSHLGPVNVYGESKLEGEKNVKYQISNVNSIPNSKSQMSKYFIVRTSWLYGQGGKNFVDTILKRARDGQTEFKIVDDQFGLPTYAFDLAQAVWEMVNQHEQLDSGIYHVTNSKFQILNFKSLPAKAYALRRGQAGISNDKCQMTNATEETAGITWYDFACEIFKQAKELGILSKLPIITPCATAEFPRLAKRPKYGALISTKLPALRSWQSALTDYLKTKLSNV